MGAKPNEYRELSRADLKGFNAEAVDIVLKAMRLGGKGRVSSKGHCILRAPNGATMSVSRSPSLANRGMQNMVSSFAKAFPDAEARLAELDRKDDTGTTTGSLALVPDHDTVMFECPAKGCEAEFVTYGACYSHVEKEHFKCFEDGCNYVGATQLALNGHKAMAHSENPPWKRAAEARTGRRKGKKSELTDAEIVKRLRELLAKDEDPKVADLQGRLADTEAELAEARKRIADLEAKLALLKEAFEA